MKEKECPNCGASNPETISEGEFRCNFCGTLFHDENILQRKKAQEKKAQHTKMQEMRYQAQLETAKASGNMTKKILLFVFAILVIIFGFVFYMAKKSMDDSSKYQEELIKSFQNQTK